MNKHEVRRSMINEIILQHTGKYDSHIVIVGSTEEETPSAIRNLHGQTTVYQKTPIIEVGYTGEMSFEGKITTEQIKMFCLWQKDIPVFLLFKRNLEIPVFLKAFDEFEWAFVFPGDSSHLIQNIFLYLFSRFSPLLESDYILVYRHFGALQDAATNVKEIMSERELEVEDEPDEMLDAIKANTAAILQLNESIGKILSAYGQPQRFLGLKEG